MVDEYGPALTADFRQFYNTRFDDYWDGLLTGGELADLVQGLLTVPYSRYRAEFFEKHPPKAPEVSDGRPGWMGWQPRDFRETAYWNYMLTANGMKKSGLLKTPDAEKKLVIPKTTADFLKLLDRRGIPYSNGDAPN